MFVKRAFMVLVLLLVPFLGVTTGYAYFDETTHEKPVAMPTGAWAFNKLQGALESLEDAYMTFFGETTIEDLYQNEDFLDLLELAGEPRPTGGGLNDYTVNGILLEDVSWSYTGNATAGNNARSIGFFRFIDRILDTNDNPVHAIVPPAPSDPPPYDQYNAFTAFDSVNTETFNRYAFRLEGGSVLTTENALSGLESIEFYALRGLSMPGETLSENRTFTVSVSENGADWTLLGTETLISPSSEEEEYPFYAYSIPEELTEEDLFVRIVFNGQAGRRNTDPNISRMVVDGFTLVADGAADPEDPEDPEDP